MVDFDFSDEIKSKPKRPQIAEIMIFKLGATMTIKSRLRVRCLILAVFGQKCFQVPPKSGPKIVVFVDKRVSRV